MSEYEQGFQDGQESCDDGRGNYQDGYDSGWSEGKAEGYDEGHSDGYNEANGAIDHDLIYTQEEVDEQLRAARQAGFEAGLAHMAEKAQTVVGSHKAMRYDDEDTPYGNG